jgi:hypothetical protein
VSTVTATYDYVYFGGGPGHTRQPRSTTGPGGFSLISSLSGGTLQTGDLFAVGAQPATLLVNNATYNFAFMNVSGGVPPGQTSPSGVNSFNNISPPPPVTVGSTSIVVLVVYVPPVGGGPGGSGAGASIDSFDESTGQLFSDTFVSVSPDPGGPPPPLTKSGNVDGYVDTTKANETITALSPTSPTGVDFVQWVNLYREDTAGIAVDGAKLTVNQGAWVYALAFYEAPPPLTTCETLLKNWNALEPKTNVVLLEYYAEKLSACQGPQYTAAVNEIKVLLKDLAGPLKPPALG